MLLFFRVSTIFSWYSGFQFEILDAEIYLGNENYTHAPARPLCR